MVRLINILVKFLILKKDSFNKLIPTPMKTILSTPERFNDYLEDDDIMGSISKDAYIMANKMYEQRNKK